MLALSTITSNCSTAGSENRSWSAARAGLLGKRISVLRAIGTGLFAQFTQTDVGGQPTVEQALSVVLAVLALLGLGIFGPPQSHGWKSRG
jgi:hypothetical protein